MQYGMDYRMQPYPPDGWDIAKWVGLFATGVSIILLLSGDKKSLGNIATSLIATTVVHAIEPPRCSTCRVRSVKNDPYWVCPDCGNITGMIIEAAVQEGIKKMLPPNQ